MHLVILYILCLVFCELMIRLLELDDKPLLRRINAVVALIGMVGLHALGV